MKRRVPQPKDTSYTVQLTDSAAALLFSISDRSHIPQPIILEMALRTFNAATKDMYTFNHPPNTQRFLTRQERDAYEATYRNGDTRPMSAGEILRAMATNNRRQAR